MKEERELMKETICPICENHCLLDAPKCGRGRRYKEGMEHPEGAEKEDLKSLFMSCAHILQHRQEKKQGQKRVMKALMEKGTMTQREMSEMFDIRSASLSELLIKLEDKGLIVRNKLEEDRRNVQVTLTEEGRKFAEEQKALAHGNQNRKDLFAVLSDDEKQQLLLMLKKLYDDWALQQDHFKHHKGHGCKRDHEGKGRSFKKHHHELHEKTNTTKEE